MLCTRVPKTPMIYGTRLLRERQVTATTLFTCIAVATWGAVDSAGASTGALPAPHAASVSIYSA